MIGITRLLAITFFVALLSFGIASIARSRTTLDNQEENTMIVNPDEHKPAPITTHHRYVCCHGPHEVYLTPKEHRLRYIAGAPRFICSVCYDRAGFRYMMDYLGGEMVTKPSKHKVDGEGTEQ